MFAAVFVRRFGPRFFIYGFLAWMGYFFSVIMGGGFAAVPELIEAVAIAAAWALLLSITILADRPAATLRRTLNAFWIRGRQVADATVEVLDAPTNTRALRRLNRALLRLNETALLVDGHLGTVDTGPGDRSQVAVRGWVIDAELAIDAIASTAWRVATTPATLTVEGRATLREMLVRLGAGDVTATARLAKVLHQQDDNPLAQVLLTTVSDLRSVVDHWHAATDPEADATVDGQAPFEPAVTLAMGNLPGSAALGASMLEQQTHHRFNPLARLDLITRQALQVGLAAALAIVAGSALDSQRYYWAVIAAFVAFTGTTTVAETTRKATSRLAGTLIGLGFSIVLAEATAGHTTLALVVILVSLFLGFYLQRLSYGAMIFFITIMIGQLYSLLNEFSSGLLVLRLQETAIGAAIGIAVSLLLLPTGTRATARTARAALLQGLGELLGNIATHDQLDTLAPSPLRHRLIHLHALLTRFADTADNPAPAIVAMPAADRSAHVTDPLGGR